MTGVLPRYAPLLLLALAWEAVSRLGIVPIAALPPLDQVAGAWLNLAESGDLWTNGVSSMARGAEGLALRARHAPILPNRPAAAVMSSTRRTSRSARAPCRR